MCPHSNIVLLPTPENSWGISDTWHLKCTLCKKVILLDVSEKELTSFLSQYNYQYVSEKYIRKCCS